MIHLIYISSATSWPTEQDLLELLKQSRVNNHRQQLTGMLLYGNATYLQVLEGDPENVHHVFDAICRDPRNTGIVKLHEAEIEQRDFPDWSMGFKNLESLSPDEVPGFADVFNGKLDKQVATNNRFDVVNFMLNFASKNA
ncbi:MAG: BLUF domain-containing protein [Chromatiales bacterium]